MTSREYLLPLVFILAGAPAWAQTKTPAAAPPSLQGTAIPAGATSKTPSLVPATGPKPAEGDASAASNEDVAASDGGLCPDGEGGPAPPDLGGVDLPRAQIRRARTTMGSVVQLGVSGLDCRQANRAFIAVFDEYARIERLTSTDDPDAGLFRINQAAGSAPVVVDAELFGLIRRALSFAEQTRGAFDPTFAAMDGVWPDPRVVEPGAPPPTLPSADVVDTARAKVGYQKVVLDRAARSVLLTEPGMRMSPGGIARGYATDRAVAKLRALGVVHFILRLPGEVFVAGDPSGDRRKVGVPDPRGPGAYALIPVRDRALNISRDDEKYIIVDHVRYHHIIDPRTGYPAHHMRSVALLAPDATTADALSTAVFVLGPDAGMALVERWPSVEALLLDTEARVHLSSGLPDDVELSAPAP